VARLLGAGRPALFAIRLLLSGKSVRGGLAEASLATAIKLLLQPACRLRAALFVDLRSVPAQAALLLAALPTGATPSCWPSNRHGG
jgi:predicted permease